MNIQQNILDSVAISIVATILGSLLSATLAWLYTKRKIPQSHRVAVIGFPQAGKTSLIVSIFAFYFRHGVTGATILPRGEETIRRVNMHIAEMESGRGVSSTRDQDLFAYRAEVLRKSLIPFFDSRYKLEMGDFPGEQSEDFVLSDEPWLHNTNYFEWAMGADTFLFVIEAPKAIMNELDYVAAQKSAFRAAWQRIQEHHIDGARSLRRKATILVYTKADVLLDVRMLKKDRMFALEELKMKLDIMFADLINYMCQSAPRFRTVLTSVVARNLEERVGVEEVARLILPKSK
jgi:hypothetical protein